MNEEQFKELAGELCFLLLPDDIGIDKKVTQKTGWAQKLYLGGSAQEAILCPKAARIIQDFMRKHNLNVEELLLVLKEVEEMWQTVSVS